MTAKILEKSDLNGFVDSLRRDYEVYGPKRKRREYFFGEIESPSELDLTSTVPTILPPKKFLFPPSETILSFKDARPIVNEERSDRKKLIIGIRSCDVNGFLILDNVFMGLFPMPSYAERRENMVLVALTCTEVGETCFCQSMKTGPCPRLGYDLLMTDIGEAYLVEPGSKNGETLMVEVKGREASKDDLEKKKRAIEAAEKKFRKNVDTENLSKIFEKNLNHEIWKRLGEIDLACANCINSCPTCFCFDIRDKLGMPMVDVARCREWDACFLLEFSEVALGGNFRKDRSARVRQFMGHNLGWGGASQFEELNGVTKCVGCGRCIRACPAHIDITEVARELRGG